MLEERKEVYEKHKDNKERLKKQKLPYLSVYIGLLNSKLRCRLYQSRYQFLDNFHFRSNNVERYVFFHQL